jgi:hypothetical protein
VLYFNLKYWAQMTKFLTVFLGKVRCDPALQTSYFFSPCLTAGNRPFADVFMIEIVKVLNSYLFEYLQICIEGGW